MAELMQDLNRYTGLLLLLCAALLCFCIYILNALHEVLLFFRSDYRKVHGREAREDAEREARYDL